MTRSFVCGCAGLELTFEERSFFSEAQPWGLILFARNCDNPAQITALIADFRNAVGRLDAPVLIDQEGGRVQRLVPPHWPRYPGARLLGAHFRTNRTDALAMAEILGSCLADDLSVLGITVDCTPVLDVPVPGAHDIIGDRAFSDDPVEVAALGGAVSRGLLKGGVVPVIKHIPGHGRAGVDSHVDLPVVETSGHNLRQSDFRPFAELNDLPAAMTAHVIYTAFDERRPATLSPVVIDRVIRGQIGFDGLLISDDLSMHALSGSLASRAQAAFDAGIDMALHCNGILAEMAAVAEHSPVLAGEAAHRAAAVTNVQKMRPHKETAENRAKLLDWAAESKKTG
jgi:beta-N-acetylhexosaminidase